MIRECQLVFKHYIVDAIKPGMLYLTFVHPIGWQISKIEKAPQDSALYIQEHGYPVGPFIVDIGNPNLPEEEILATPNQIGWMDEGEHTDELMDIELKHMNKILDDDDGWLFIEVDEEGKPILFMDKVTLSYADDVEEDIDYEDGQINLADEDEDDYNNIF